MESFNIQYLLHRKSKHHGTKPMHPSSSTAFQRHQEHDLKHPSWVDLITTKQNKLPSFIDKLQPLSNLIHQYQPITSLIIGYNTKKLGWTSTF